MTKKQIPTYSCAVEAALDVIGGKWKGVLVYHLLERTCRFGELQRLIPSITRRMLTLTLRELEEAGIVHREVYQQVPPKVEYSITDYGNTLKPIILALWSWGNMHIQNPKPPCDKKALSHSSPELYSLVQQ